ncbi:MAG: septal ring lytic transglycosylase RlpA family protein [Bacteroidia bacterium]
MKYVIWFFLLAPSYLMAQVYEGQASFYNDKLHGNETASGDRYDKFAFTAAHRTLPFGTWVKVTNLWNGKSVEVRINDRGPFGKDQRIIDLSKQAAIDLQMVTAGVVDVKVEIIEKKEALSEDKPIEKVVEERDPYEGLKVRGDGTFKVNVSTTSGLLGYGVQVGSFTDFLSLLKKLEELEKLGFPDLYVNTAMVKGKRYFRIVVGNFENKASAELYLVSVKSKGIDGYVIAHQTKE